MLKFAPVAAAIFLLGAGAAAAEAMACCKEKCCCEKMKQTAPTPQPAPQQPSKPAAPGHQH